MRPIGEFFSTELTLYDVVHVATDSLVCRIVVCFLPRLVKVNLGLGDFPVCGGGFLLQVHPIVLNLLLLVGVFLEHGFDLVGRAGGVACTPILIELRKGFLVFLKGFFRLIECLDVLRCLVQAHGCFDGLCRGNGFRVAKGAEFRYQ